MRRERQVISKQGGISEIWGNLWGFYNEALRILYSTESLEELAEMSNEEKKWQLKHAIHTLLCHSNYWNKKS